MVSELLILLCFDIEEGHHDSPFEIVPTTSAPNLYVGLNRNLVGEIKTT